MTEQPTYAIRPATELDSDLIKRTIKQAGLDPTALDWRRFHLAVDADGRMVGCCQVRRYGDVRELGSLYVSEHCRGRGIGAALVRVCLAEQTPPVHLECVEARQPYYEQFGFRRIPTQQAPFRLWIKAGIGGTLVWLVWRERIIVMRWDG